MNRSLLGHILTLGLVLVWTIQAEGQGAPDSKAPTVPPSQEKANEEAKKAARDKADAAMIEAMKRGTFSEVDTIARAYATQYPEGERDIRGVLLADLTAKATTELDSMARMLEVMKRESKSPEELSNVQQILGNLHFRTKAYAEAEKEMRAAMESKVQRLGKDNRGALYCTRRLGQIMLDAGKSAEAETLLLRACEGYRRVVPRGHIHRDEALLALALFYGSTSSTYEKALVLWKEIADDRESLSKDSLPAMYARRREGRTLRFLNRPKESLEVLESLLPRVHAHAGKESESAAFTHGELGWTFLWLERYADAAKHLRISVDIWKNSKDPGNSFHLEWRTDLGLCLRNLKLYEEAITLHRETLELRRQHLPADKKAMAKEVLFLMQSLYLAGQTEESLTLLRAGIELQREEAKGDTSHTLENLTLLAMRFSALKRHDEAVSTIQEVMQRRKAAGGQLSKDEALGYEKLAEILTASGKASEAAAAHESALELHLKTHGWKDDHAVRVLDKLAQLRLYQLADYASAEQDFRRLIAHNAEAGVSADTQLMFTARLAECLQKKGHRDEAFRMLLDVIAHGMDQAPQGVAILKAHHVLAVMAHHERQWITTRAHYLRLAALHAQRNPVREAEVAKYLHHAADVVREIRQQDAEQAPQEMLEASCDEAERALAMRRKLLGNEHDDTLSSLWVARVQHTYAGHASAAQVQGKELIETRLKKSGEDSLAFASALRGVAWTETVLKNFAQGELLLRRAKSILDRLGENGSKEVKSEMGWVVENLANNLESQKRFPEAVQMRKESVTIRTELLGADDDLTLRARADLAWNLRATGNYNEAMQVYRDLLASRIQRHGKDSLQVANTLDGLAYLYEKQQDYPAALTAYTETLRIRRLKLQPDHDSVLESLKDMADVLEEQGSFQEALKCANEAAAFARKKFPPGNEDWDLYSAKQARLLQLSGDATGAERLLQEDRATVLAHCGEISPAHAEALSNLGFFFRRLQQHEKAEESFETVLRIYEQLPGMDSEMADAMDDVASTYADLQKVEKAVEMQERRIKILRKLYPEGHADLAEGLSDLATTCWGTDLPRAAKAVQEAQDIARRILGPEHITTRKYMLQFCMLAPFTGDLALADRQMQSVVPMIEKYSGRESREYAYARMSQAMIYIGMHDMPRVVSASLEAEPLLKRFGEDTSMFDLILGVHDVSEGRNGDGLKRLEAHLQRVIAKNDEEIQSALGLMVYVSSLYEASGDQAAAGKWFSKALELGDKIELRSGFNTGYFHLNCGLRLMDKGDVEGLERHVTKAIEATAGDNAQAYIRRMAAPMLAVAKIARGRHDEAKSILQEALEQQKGWLREVLTFGTEQQRLDTNVVQGAFGLPEICLEAGDADLAASALLRSKAIALESLAEERRLARVAKDPALSALVEKLNEKRREFSATVGVKNITELEELQSELARKVSGLGEARKYVGVVPGEVAHRLPAHTCLVEFSLHTGLGLPRYSAVVITPEGRCILVPLGPADVIDTTASALQSAMRDGAATSESVEKLLRELYTVAWQPILSQLPNETRAVILSPDGALHFVPFAALLSPEGKFAVEKMDILHVTSGRDLIRQALPAPAEKRMVVVADPDFDKHLEQNTARPTGGTGAPWITKEEAAAKTFGRLSGTAKEMALLKNLARERSIPFETISEGQATEGSILSLSAPHVLHLSTHGYFLGQSKQDASSKMLAVTRGVGGIRPAVTTTPQAPGMAGAPTQDPLAMMSLVVPANSMERAGLALAGANRTFAAWTRGERVSPMDDGFLSAAEVAEMNLEGTWLVVLSACDTASGELRGAEGVMGLRRGFIQAGATNLMTTLWEILDEETVSFMGDFYRAALKSGKPPQALSETQRNWLLNLRKERGLSEAVRIAGPFVLNFVGQP